MTFETVLLCMGIGFVIGFISAIMFVMAKESNII